MQIIMVFECNKKSSIDFLYVKEVLNSRYVYNHKLTPIFVDGKTNIASSKTLTKVNNAKSNMNSTSAVIVFADLDSDFVNGNKELNEKITSFCKDNNFDLVWFNRDIEEVFLGHRVPKSDKRSCVDKFIDSRAINKLSLSILSDNNCVEHIKHSNMLCVINKYFNNK